MGDWLSADNVVAVLTALLGVAVSVGVVWYERRVPSHRRIGYRVQMDTPIGSDDPDGGGGAPNVRLGLFNDLPDMSDATLVLIRVENDGGVAVTDTDYTNRDPGRALTVVFAGRTVRGVAVTESDSGLLMDHFAPAGDNGGIRHQGNVIHLPRVPLNRGQHFKLLVLLTGGHVGGDVRVTGGIRDGVVVPNKAMPVDSTPPLFSRAARWLTILLTLCVTVLAGLIVVRDDAPPPMGCATGQLTVTGSTAFAPVMGELARRYTADCPDARIRVDAHGSNEGVRELAETRAPDVVALSDGPKPEGASRLEEQRVAVAAFALVVSDDVPLTDLSTDQIRRVFSGSVVNWSELGGPDLPVLLVSRNADSGTRDLFRRRVLDGRGEPAFTSRDCVHRNSPEDRVVRCELDSTDQVLGTVARLPGAIGYGELRAATAAKGLHTLAVNGRTPTPAAIGDSSYPFTEIEYAYTYDRPAVGSLAASFLAYMIRGAGQDVVTSHGHLPCHSPEGLERCRP